MDLRATTSQAMDLTGTTSQALMQGMDVNNDVPQFQQPLVEEPTLTQILSSFSAQFLAMDLPATTSQAMEIRI